MDTQQAEYHMTGPGGKAERKTSREVRDMVYAAAGIAR